VAALFCSIMLALLPAVLIPGLRVHIRPLGADISMSCFRRRGAGRGGISWCAGRFTGECCGRHAARITRPACPGTRSLAMIAKIRWSHRMRHLRQETDPDDMRVVIATYPARTAVNAESG
jgi:hypothetical protein